MSSDVVFDAVIEERITMEIIADAYNEYEIAAGWACYLTDQLSFPFQAKCIKKINTSPLAQEEVVSVIGIDSDSCEHDMFVTVNWNNRIVSVPLSQLEGIDVDEATLQGMTDWNYWINSGHSF